MVHNILMTGAGIFALHPLANSGKILSISTHNYPNDMTDNRDKHDKFYSMLPPYPAIVAKAEASYRHLFTHFIPSTALDKIIRKPNRIDGNVSY